jgi:hypothetical protein
VYMRILNLIQMSLLLIVTDFYCQYMYFGQLGETRLYFL